MRKKIINTINDVISLLENCNYSNKADWFKSCLDVIKNKSENSEEFIENIKKIRSIIAGMGSFSDLGLVPKKESKLSIEDAWALQNKLAKELDEITGYYLDLNKKQ